MKRAIFGIAGLVVSTLIVLGIVISRPVPKVHAAIACSDSLLSGTYGAYYFGKLGGGTVNTVEVWSFDGSANWTMDEFQMNNGVLQEFTLAGTYHLANSSNGGCQGTITPSGSNQTREIVTANGGVEVYSIITASTGNVTEVMKKQ